MRNQEKYWECSKTEEREDICSCFEPSIFKDQAIEEKVRDYLRGADTFEREELLSFVKHMKSCYSQVGKSLGVQ